MNERLIGPSDTVISHSHMIRGTYIFGCHKVSCRLEAFFRGAKVYVKGWPRVFPLKVDTLLGRCPRQSVCWNGIGTFRLQFCGVRLVWFFVGEQGICWICFGETFGRTSYLFFSLLTRNVQVNACHYLLLFGGIVFRRR